MTRNEILRAMQTHFEELFGVWSTNADRKGMGALVFITGNDATAQKEIDFEYLTLGELGDYLRSFSDDHEFVHRLVKQAESVHGIPVVIIPSANPANAKFPSSSVGSI